MGACRQLRQVDGCSGQSKIGERPARSRCGTPAVERACAPGSWLLVDVSRSRCARLDASPARRCSQRSRAYFRRTGGDSDRCASRDSARGEPEEWMVRRRWACRAQPAFVDVDREARWARHAHWVRRVCARAYGRGVTPRTAIRAGRRHRRAEEPRRDRDGRFCHSRDGERP